MSLAFFQRLNPVLLAEGAALVACELFGNDIEKVRDGMKAPWSPMERRAGTGLAANQEAFYMTGKATGLPPVYFGWAMGFLPRLDQA